MSFYKQDLRDEVGAHLQDDAKFLTPEEIDIFINSAVRHLSLDAPFIKVKDIAADGTNDLALPSDYTKGWSDIESVETPTGYTPPTILDKDDDWFIYENPTKSAGAQMRLRFKATTPASGTMVRCILTQPHAVSATASTFNSRTFQAATYFVLSLSHNALAAKFNQGSDPTIAADSVDYSARAQNALFQAREYEKKYRQTLGLDEKPRAAQAIGEFDMSYSNKDDFLFHPKSER